MHQPLLAIAYFTCAAANMHLANPIDTYKQMSDIVW